MLPIAAGSTFSEKPFKKLPESEKCGRKTLDGECDGYVWGLAGPESGDVEKVSGYKHCLKGQRSDEDGR